LEPIPEAERGDMVKAYHSRLNSDDEHTRITAAKAWSKWEWVYYKLTAERDLHDPIRMATSRLFVDPGYLAKAAQDDWAK
jgi:proline iminopeptidase